MAATVDVAALHDLLEEAYLAQMAQGGGRWFARRREGYTLAGFAGLDSPTMSRVALIDTAASRVPEMLDDAEDFFKERALPWCVHLTPYSRPVELARELTARGFWLASDLEVMTFESAKLPQAQPDVEVRRVGPEDAPRFTALLLEGFRMPSRFLGPLVDINRAWIENGAMAFMAFAPDGAAAGTAMLSHAGDVSTVYNVCASRAYRRKGVATSLMRALLEAYRDRQGRALSLQVARGSEAQVMYERMGFVSRYRWELYTRA